MNKQCPRISSSTTGPLGALHLPRLWEIESLAVAGLLADGYTVLDSGKGGYTAMTCDALGLDQKELKAFFQKEQPTYSELEEWVVENGTKLTVADIHRHNLAIAGYCHDDPTRKTILAAANLPDDGSVKPSAAELNDLESWQEFHASLASQE